tara:strand:+ start:90 stop:515 length:426 start_codon:yes stop_codon:yes gene_type:complete
MTGTLWISRRVLLLLLVLSWPGSVPALEALVVGTWVLAPGDPRFGELGVINEYTANGEVTIVIFETPDCKQPEYAARGLWAIVDGMLTILLTESSDDSILPSGHRRLEQIIELDGELMVVRSEVSGNLLYRLKADTCFKVT